MAFLRLSSDAGLFVGTVNEYAFCFKFLLLNILPTFGESDSVVGLDILPGRQTTQRSVENNATDIIFKLDVPFFLFLSFTSTTSLLGSMRGSLPQIFLGGFKATNISPTFRIIYCSIQFYNKYSNWRHKMVGRLPVVYYINFKDLFASLLQSRWM